VFKHFKYLIFFIVLLVSCNSKKPNTRKDSISVVYYPLPKKVISPKHNPTTPQKIALGKLLFYDPILSGNKDVACATCLGLSEKRKFKQPNTIPFVKRNAHTILNTAFNGLTNKGIQNPDEAQMFWDNRVKSLESQALEPLLAMEEMRGQQFSKASILDTIVNRISSNKKYQQLFFQAFKNEVISSKTIAKAIATFERSLITTNSRFDQYLRGDSTAISISEKEGFQTFKRVGCAECHSGPMFSDYKLHTLGMEENKKLIHADSGAKNKFQFRTASLRNLQFTAPYMHNGNFNSLLRVLEFYEEMQQGKVQNPNITNNDIDPLVKKMILEVKDMRPIISFINTLNDDKYSLNSIVNTTPRRLSVYFNKFSIASIE